MVHAAAVKWLVVRSGLGLVLAAAICSTYQLWAAAGQNGDHVTVAFDPPPIRDVRVLIASGAEALWVRSEGGLVLRDEEGAVEKAYPVDERVQVTATGGGLLAFDANRRYAPPVVLAGRGAATIVLGQGEQDSDRLEYPGRIRLKVRADGMIDAVNEVDVERYVACVTANEVWPTFDPEALKGQAIAVRTYVLFHMLRRAGADVDVSNTQASQVYRGVRRDTVGVRAAAATAATRGIVLTWRDGNRNRLFCAYYSAACGGTSQSAAIFGAASNVPPLAGGVPCDYCAIAPGETYRWGPVRISKADIHRRLVRRFPALASLGPLARVEAAQRTDAGRIVTVRLVGADGSSEEMLAERFRLAVGGGKLRSTHFTIRDAGRSLVFEDGRGFGHGLGLCQWGMQGQIDSGRAIEEILAYYYPGSQLTRVY